MAFARLEENASDRVPLSALPVLILSEGNVPARWRTSSVMSLL